jgi:hypothetical protein
MRAPAASIVLLLSLSLSASAADLSIQLNPTQPGRPGNEAWVHAYVNSDSIERSDIRVRFTFDPSLEILEVVHWPFLWNCTWSPGEVVCTNPEFKLGADGSILIKVRLPDSPRGGAYLVRGEVTSTGTDPKPGNNAATTTQYVIPQMHVTNTNDAGEGSLRAAIEAVNAACSLEKPCDIRFVLPGGTIPIIEPLSPLPSVTACGTIIGDLPMNANDAPPIQVELRGTHVKEGPGLDVNGRCAFNEMSVIGMAIGGFPGDGIAVRSPGNHRIWGCNIGTDAIALRAVPNGLRGIAVTAAGARTTIHTCHLSGNGRSGVAVWVGSWTALFRTRVGTAADDSPLPNGASGVFIAPDGGALRLNDSVIAHNRDFGLALASRGTVFIGPGVTITDNDTLDIDWGVDGPTPNDDESDFVPNTPRLISARYDGAAKVTRIEVALDAPQRAHGTPYVVLYASDHRTRFGTAHLDQRLATRAVDAAALNTRSMTFVVPGDLRGRFVSALAQIWSVQWFPDSPAPEMLWPSEVSAAVLVE